MYNNKKYYLFIGNPKTGSSTINHLIKNKWHNFDSDIYDSKSLKKNMVLDYRARGLGAKGAPGHYNLRMHKLIEIFPKKDFDNAFKFTFVRNPYDKLVSVYYYSGYHEFDSFAKFIYNLEEWIDFTSYRDWIRNESISGFNDFHSLPQFLYVMDDLFYQPHEEETAFRNLNGIMRCKHVDFLGWYENYDQDVNKLLNILHEYYGVKIMKHTKNLKVSPRLKDYRLYYKNNKMIEIVQKLYAYDFKYFGYKFE